MSEPLDTSGDMMRVALLDALWHWAPPARCPEMQQGTVWIDRASVSRDDPPGRHP